MRPSLDGAVWQSPLSARPRRLSLKIDQKFVKSQHQTTHVGPKSPCQIMTCSPSFSKEQKHLFFLKSNHQRARKILFINWINRWEEMDFGPGEFQRLFNPTRRRIDKKVESFWGMSYLLGSSPRKIFIWLLTNKFISEPRPFFTYQSQPTTLSALFAKGPRKRADIVERKRDPK